MMVEKLDPSNGCGDNFLYGEKEKKIFMKSPVGTEESEPRSSSEDCYHLVKASMVYGKLQDNSGRSLWIQQRKNLLDSK